MARRKNKENSSATRVTLSKSVELPNRARMARFERCPELGPQILFFSGGTALRETSRRLIRYTYNSIHIITPFDSGGSSAKLREAFGMPAIGDVRNRLMALADKDHPGNRAVFELFSHRLPTNMDNGKLHVRLENMAKGNNRLVRSIDDPMRKIIRTYLYTFLDRMPEDFNLSGASIGNLVLTAGYLENRRHFDPVIYMFSKLVNVRGLVRPVINKNTHLVAELESGETVVGQHLITGKSADPITSSIRRIYLTDSRSRPEPSKASIRPKVRDLIQSADMICYPMGSFYSSILANLLPKGVGRNIARNPCIKVFIPNTGQDPETIGLGVTEQVNRIVETLCDDDPGNIRPQDVLSYVLIDSENQAYEGGLAPDAIRRLGVEVIDCPLTSKKSIPYLDPGLLVPVLMCLT